MPISIGEVQSEVTVEGEGAAGGAGGEQRDLPEPAALLRWQQAARQLMWDEARTRAFDFDD
jgi:hypothetical protein